VTGSGAAVPWYADGLRFTCTRCGNCCGGAPGYVWVNAEERRDIAAFLKITLAEFEATHTRVVGERRSLLERPNGDCEFLTRDPSGRAACRIHEVRPTQCRTWPFWRSNLETPSAWRATGRHCPGVNQGACHPLPVIRAALAANRALPL